jgi:glutathione S-transferase
MKLYYAPGACSLAPHIVAREAGVDIKLDKVDLFGSRKTESGRDYDAINPKGYVPALELDNGQVLTEGPVISQYIADRNPESGLAPAAGTLERYRLLETIGFINSEIHKTYSPLFNPQLSAERREEQLGALRKRFGLIDKTLAGKSYLLGDRFTVADAYLFVMASWADHVKLDLSGFANIKAFQQRVAARPAVQAALKAEGLLK